MAPTKNTTNCRVRDLRLPITTATSSGSRCSTSGGQARPASAATDPSALSLSRSRDQFVDVRAPSALRPLQLGPEHFEVVAGCRTHHADGPHLACDDNGIGRAYAGRLLSVEGDEDSARVIVRDRPNLDGAPGGQHDRAVRQRVGCDGGQHHRIHLRMDDGPPAARL